MTKNYIHKFFASKIISIKLPDLGEGQYYIYNPGTKEATVLKWLKKEGDAVVEEEPLVEVETDKLTTSLPAQSTGFIHKINYKAQEVCPVSCD